ncbi:acyltransferase family protein [Methylobacterium sp. WSM2598]|uniref:acyltransferase family protein n=1 Tax=Methylobacterium sp. WSM2598 TaxID=398261 RepID=UPI001F2D41E2|nr:acyltransferase [Methylobacterium sp. WSM2598]
MNAAKVSPRNRIGANAAQHAPAGRFDDRQHRRSKECLDNRCGPRPDIDPQWSDPMTSLDVKWQQASCRPRGFDLLRTSLSICIILWHSVATSYGLVVEESLYHSPLKILVWFLVPAFFALSGFLVAGSVVRNDLLSFAVLRVIRIFPALTAEVVISALILGPLFTVLTLRGYFTDKTFYVYLLNVFGDVHFTLPGVFNDLPVPNLVNAQLWTIPHELECYVAISIAAVIGLTQRPRLFLGAFAAFLVLLIMRDHNGGSLASAAQPPGRMLVLCFMFGVALYLNKEVIAHSTLLFLICTGLYAFCVLQSSRVAEDLASVFVSYVTIYIGLLDFRGKWLTRAADYSYGLYLYGFPVQQAVTQLMPGHRVWYLNFVLSLCVTSVFAAISWHGLESKVMLRKKAVLRFVAERKDGIAAGIAAAWARVRGGYARSGRDGTVASTKSAS